MLESYVAYLAMKAEVPYNIIAVDWGELSTVNSKISGAFYYENVVENVVTVGTRIGKFIRWLKLNDFVELDQVHIIGFSLGAHVAGVVGDGVKKSCGEPLARITGCDAFTWNFQLVKLQCSYYFYWFSQRWIQLDRSLIATGASQGPSGRTTLTLSMLCTQTRGCLDCSMMWVTWISM